MVGWLVAWLVDWSIGWLHSSLIGWLYSWLVGRSFGWLVGWLTDYLNCRRSIFGMFDVSFLRCTMFFMSDINFDVCVSNSVSICVFLCTWCLFSIFDFWYIYIYIFFRFSMFVFFSMRP